MLPAAEKGVVSKSRKFKLVLVAVALLAIGSYFFIALMNGKVDNLREQINATSQQPAADGAISLGQLDPDLKSQIEAATKIAGALPLTDASGNATSCGQGQVLSFSDGRIVCVTLSQAAGGQIAVTTIGQPGDPGTGGTSGTDGQNGTSGTNGANGLDGVPGTSGSNGANGTNGANGASGSTGTSGTSGSTGSQGAQGATGATGATGSAGVLSTSFGNGLSGSVASQVLGLNIVLDANGGLSNSASGISLLKSCSSGQILKWNGSSWACSADSSGAGTGGAIGGSVTGGTYTGILFVDSSGSLSDDTANFNYDPVAKKLTVTGGIDPLYTQVKDTGLGGGNAAYFEAYGGSNASTSIANTGRMRYNQATQNWEISENTGAYSALIASSDVANLALSGDVGGTLGSTLIQTGAVTLAKLATDSVDSSKIADGTIVLADLAGDSVNSSKIVDGTIVSTDLADGSVTTVKIADGNVTEIKIADGAISTNKLTADSVTSAKIVDGTIATADLADLSVTNVKLAADAVTSAKILDGTIATADLADGLIVTAKLSDGSVTSAKIVDGTIVTADIADGAATLAKLAADSVDSSKIVDGTVATADLADNSVSTAKIQADAVTTAKILDGTVATADIANDAITAAKIADGTIADADINATANIALTKLAGGTTIVTSLGAPSGSNANGGSITSNVLTLSYADATNPGIVSALAQTFAGNKTFNNNVNVSGLVTIGTNVADAGALRLGNGEGAGIVFRNAANSLNAVGMFLNAADNRLYVGAAGSSGFYPASDVILGGNVGIGSTAPGSKLVVNASTGNALDVTNTGSGTVASLAGSGGVVLNPFGTTAGNTTEQRYGELAANGTNYVGFKAPDAIAANTTWVLPGADGSNGQLLSTNGTGGLSWTTAGVADSVQNVSTNTTLADWNRTVLVDTTSGSVTVTLPAAASNTGKTITIKKISSDNNSVIVDANASETIDGSATVTMSTAQGSTLYRSDGTNVKIVADANESYVAAENGFTELAAQTTTSGTLEDVTGGAIPLTAGTWEISYNVQTDHTTGDNSSIHLAITNASNVVVDGSEKTRGGTVTTAQPLTASVIVTVPSSEVYKLRKSDGGGGTMSILNTASHGSTITWKKIGGYAPVIGQSVDYVHVGSATLNQPTTAGAAVVFPTILSGNIPYSTSTGQFTLTAGKTYRLEGSPTGGSVYWYNVTGAANLSEDSSGSATNNAANLEAVAYFTPSVNSIVELRATSTSTFTSANGVASGSFTARVQQLGSTAFTGVAMNALTNAIAAGSLDNTNYAQTWNWSTANTQTGLSMTANALTTGEIVDFSTASTSFTGNLLNLTSTGNSGGVTGTLAKLDIVGSSSAAKGLAVNNAGTGDSINVASTGTGLAFNATGALALKKGTDYSTVGTTNDWNPGNTSLVRLTGATAQTITGITGGVDGKVLTIINAGSAAASLTNQDVLSTAANRIITGTGSNLSLAVDASISLVYDSGASRWRVVGGTGSGSSNASVTLGNFATGGVVGTAAATVDVANNLNIAQTTTLQTLTLPSPTTTTAGKLVTVSNTGSASFTMYGSQIASGTYSSGFVWTGTAWQPLNAANNVASDYGENNGITANQTLTTTIADIAGSSFTLPSAGVWEVSYNIYARQTNTATYGSVVLTDSANSIVPNSTLQISSQLAAVSFTETGFTQTVRITTTGSATYKLRGVAAANAAIEIHNTSSSGTVATQQGNSKITWKKISGNVAVSGQSVDYVNVNAGASQITGIAANSPILFNTPTTVGNIPFASNTFTLTAGKTYRLAGAPGAVSGTTDMRLMYQWRDTTNNAYFGSIGSRNSPTGGNNNALPVGSAEAVITPTSNITVQLWMTDFNGGGTPTGIGVTAAEGRSWATITQLGSTNASTGVAMSTLTAALASNALDNTNYAQTWNWSTLSTGTGLSVNYSSLTSGIGQAVVANVTGLTGDLYNITLSGNNAGNTGNLLNLNSSGAASVAKALNVTVASTGALTNGGVRFNFTGAHTGSGLQLDDVTATGVAEQINVNGLTSGSGLRVASSSTSMTGSLVQFAATGAANTGTTLSLGNSSATTGLALSITSGGIALERGTDYSTVGATNNVAFSNHSNIRLTGASAQSITGIANGTNGRMLILTNAGTTTATLSNNSGSSTAANRITGGNGRDVAIQPGASTILLYDTGASLWRVINGEPLYAHVRANSMTGSGSASPGTAITFANEEYDTTGAFNNATGIFTAPRTGRYHVSFQAFIGSSSCTAGSRFGFIFSKNGASFGAGNPISTVYCWSANPTTAGHTGTETINLNAGDTFTLRAFLDGAVSFSLSANNNFDYITIDEMP